MIEATQPEHSRGIESQTSELHRWRIPLSDLAVDEELVDAVTQVVRSGWWSMGPVVDRFEQSFAEYCGVEHAVAVANGTAALHLALLAIPVGPGDEVILPSLNFVAAANTVAQTGATPVFCDIGGDGDLNLDPVDLEAAVGPATKALLVLHYGGHPCDMEAVLEVAARHGLAVIEDAAHAPGGRWRDQACGTIGDVGCFSFFSNKNLPTGEGGMVVTDSSTLARDIRLRRSHGMTTLTWDRARGQAHSYDVVTQGFNYRMTELFAVVGINQLERLSARNDARARVVSRYRSALHGRNGLIVPFAPREDSMPSHHLAVVVLPEGAERDEIRDSLTEQGIQTSVHYPPIHRFTQYEHLSELRQLPRTDSVASRILTLPLFPHMTDEQVELVIDAVRTATDR